MDMAMGRNRRTSDTYHSLVRRFLGERVNAFERQTYDSGIEDALNIMVAVGAQREAIREAWTSWESAREDWQAEFERIAVAELERAIPWLLRLLEEAGGSLTLSQLRQRATIRSGLNIERLRRVPGLDIRRGLSGTGHRIWLTSEKAGKTK